MRCIKLKTLTHPSESMFNISHINVKDFFLLDENEAIKYVELQSIMLSKDVFLNYRAKPLSELTFGQVSEIKRNFINPDYKSLLNCFKIVFKVKEDDYRRSDIIPYFYALNWIKDQIMVLIEKEKMLIPDPDPELEMAGVKKLTIFSEMSILINLAEKFSTTPMAIETWTYNLVFTIILYQKLLNEVRRDYIYITKSK